MDVKSRMPIGDSALSNHNVSYDDEGLSWYCDDNLTITMKWRFKGGKNTWQKSSHHDHHRINWITGVIPNG